MALRSPVQIHNFWGASFATSNDLPNEPGNVITVAPLNLQAGDFAYVIADTTFYVCTDPGTVNNGGDATWVQITTGAATIDRFAPKYLVGNTLAPWSDSNVAFNANGFNYYPDPGDGTGIAAALAAANTVAGDVWIRPGTYTLASNAAALSIPANVRVQGAGASTVIAKSIGTEGDVLTVFTLEDSSELRDIVVTQTMNDAPSYGFSGLGVVQLSLTDNDPSSAHVERVKVSVTDGIVTFPHAAAAYYVIAGCALEADRCDAVLTGTGTPGVGDVNTLSGWRMIDGSLRLDACTTSGGDRSVQASGGLATVPVSIDQCSFTGFLGVAVLTDNCDLSVTGMTSIGTASTGSVFGIKSTGGGTLAANARITLPVSPGGSEVGISASVNSGQIVGSRVEATQGINSLNSLGRGVAIGFNSVIHDSLTTGISGQAVDEIAHNILSV